MEERVPLLYPVLQEETVTQGVIAYSVLHLGNVWERLHRDGSKEETLTGAEQNIPAGQLGA